VNNTGPSHVSEDLLLRYVDGELTQREAAAVRDHLDACSDCSRAVDQYRRSLDALLAWHRDRKQSLPAPPLPWKSPFPAPRVPGFPAGRGRTIWRWGAIAAAAVLVMIAWQLSTRQTVSAAELLEKASVQERSARPRRQIQIRTARHTVRRPAIAAKTRTAAEADLRALFETARFNWEDPLSARSFTAWRGQLSASSDDVRVVETGGRHYQIRTTTPDGALAEATITLRAADMLAVRETLQFRNSESVEITEAPEQTQVPAPDVQIATNPPASDPQHATDTPGALATASDELRVFSALHQLGADLGEPVGVRRDDATGRVVISMLGLGAEREQQIRAAIAGLPNVVIQTEQPEAMRAPSTAARRGATAQTNRELESRVGSGPVLQNFVNEVLDHSDAALARAHALRNLAVRFPPEVEAQLASGDRALLDGIVRDHVQALDKHAAQLRTLLKPFLGETRAGAASAARWQDEAVALVAAAQSLDAILSEYVAGSGGTADRVGAALSDLERRIAAKP
jgi:hypothetical protein